jgi:HD superfamily phosphohydrolase/tRNA A-37 threonylcarbamoyl transferase component Bud32
MDVFEKIEKALSKNKKSDILCFGKFKIENNVKKPSQQGMVVIAKNSIGKKFAIKFYHPKDPDPQILKDGVKRFIQEIRILSLLNHKNIVKVYTGGKALWNEKKNKWFISEGFNNEEKKTSEILYYIMDFIEGYDVSSIFPELRKEISNILEFEKFPINERVISLENMISQVSKAIHYYHSKNITHKDIKPDNIRFSKEDSTFIIVDFGFAHHITSPQDQSSIIRTEYFDVFSIDAEDYKSNDLAQFSLMLLKILPSFRNEYGNDRFEGIMSILERAKHQNLKKRYKNALEFYNSIKQYFIAFPEWKFQPQLNQYLCSNRFGKFSSQLRIPVWGSILLTKEVRDIIDTPDFQRLRGVRQLGPTIFVFPGANGTRFEHSLGTYFLSLKYLEKIMGLSAFGELCESKNETIKLILLSSLLHDIGHYPYSHWIEEIDDFPNKIKFPKHEVRAKEIICKENGIIRKLIEEQWEVSPEAVSSIIAGKGVDNKQLLANSFIDSAIDVDKVDYLVRDSLHCGVNYGKGIDVERLLNSLCINPNTKKICLTEKGVSCLLSIITCRNIMYQEVYWHKTIRACDAMFKRFFYEYIRKNVESIETIKKYLSYPDDHFIEKLYVSSKKWKQLNDLIAPFSFRGRSLYKPVYLFSETNSSKEPAGTKRFFEKVLANKPYSDMIEINKKLVHQLKHLIPNIKPLDILIEKTPTKSDHEIYNLQEIKVKNTRHNSFNDYPKEFDGLNLYLKNNRQAYIFCKPKYYNILQELIHKRKFEEILGEI